MKKRIISLCTICVLITMMSTLVLAYDHVAAQVYADEWAYGYNTDYVRCDKDCANFVSQCLKAGRLSEDFTWYHNNILGVKKLLTLGRVQMN